MRLAAVCAVILVLSSCERQSPPPPPPDHSALRARADSPATAVLAAELRGPPERGTDWGLPSAEHGRIRDNSPTGIRIAQSYRDVLYQRALSIDPEPLAGTRQWTTYGVLRDALERERALRV